MEEFKTINTIYFAKMRADALIPKKEDENAGYDLYASFDEDYIIIEPFTTGIIPTGLAWACSPNYYLQFEERSSTGLKGIKVSGGIIDSGYRGELKIALFNANPKALIFSPLAEDVVFKKLEKNGNINKDDYIFYSTSKAIAQGIVHRVEDMIVKEISLAALREIPSKRGEKGWGSTNTRQNLDKIKELIKETKGVKHE